MRKMFISLSSSLEHRISDFDVKITNFFGEVILLGAGKVIGLLFLFGAIPLKFDASAGDVGLGIVIYSTMDHARDEIAIAVPFTKVERCQLITNVTTADGKIIRLTNNQLKQIVQTTDLTGATVVDDTGLRKLQLEASSLRAMQDRYPQAIAVIAPVADRIERAAQAIESGNVLVKGSLVPRADYEKQMAASAPKTINLTVDGRSYSGARLSSVSGESVSIMHSGGVASVAVDQLSDEQIAQLNGTSSVSGIERQMVVKGKGDASPTESAETQTDKANMATSPPQPASEVATSGRSSEAEGEPKIARKLPSIGAMPDIRVVAELLHEKLQEAARRLQQEGRHLEVRTALDIEDQIIEGTAAFMDYDTSVLVASNVIDNFGNDVGRKQHRELMAQLASEPDQKKAGEIKQLMLDNAQSYYTGNIKTLHAEGSTGDGRDLMMRTMSKAAKSAFMHVAFLQETRSRQGVQVSYRREMAGISVLSEEEMLQFHTRFDIPTRMDIAKALQTGKWEDVDLSILGDEGEQDSYKQSLLEAHRRSGEALGRQLETYNTSAAADRTLTNTFSEMDELEYYRGVVPRMIEQARQRRSLP